VAGRTTSSQEASLCKRMSVGKGHPIWCDEGRRL
jgi:hypothetical protein